MPREQINHPSLDQTEPARPFEGAAPAAKQWRDPAVHVRWERDYVQVVLEADPGYLHYCADHEEPGPPGRASVFSPVLTRSEVNRMINALRRARDRAYG